MKLTGRRHNPSTRRKVEARTATGAAQLVTAEEVKQVGQFEERWRKEEGQEEPDEKVTDPPA